MNAAELSGDNLQESFFLQLRDSNYLHVSTKSDYARPHASHQCSWSANHSNFVFPTRPGANGANQDAEELCLEHQQMQLNLS
jgi:hypothetical protein